MDMALSNGFNGFNDSQHDECGFFHTVGSMSTSTGMDMDHDHGMDMELMHMYFDYLVQELSCCSKTLTSNKGQVFEFFCFVCGWFSTRGIEFVRNYLESWLCGAQPVECHLVRKY